MNLDEFLRALETLIDDREADDDDPGEGNFNCEDCRACNNCRFCVGCDSCEDCTYCDESIECTSCTQSKRCVTCERVSYCEDCRDCKNSRYLTLCVGCTNCVHCLACVGIDGGEFFVLNQKRTRKEYFAILRQVQERMADRMVAGWRPPGIGLASEIVDVATATRDSPLSAAPWLDELAGLVGPAPIDVAEEAPTEAVEREVSEPLLAATTTKPAPRSEERWSERVRERSEAGRRRDLRGTEREPARERERLGDLRRDPLAEPIDDDLAIDPDTFDRPRRDRARSTRERDRLDVDLDWRERPNPRDYGRSRRPEGELRPAGGYDLGPASDEEEGWTTERYDSRHGRRYDSRDDRRPASRRPAPGASDGWADEDVVVSRGRDEERTRPFDGGRDSEGSGSSRPAWEDSREATVARARPREPRRDDRSGGRKRDRDRRPADDAPAAKEREPSSPWLDDERSKPGRSAKRNSLRRAGRPKRQPSGERGDGSKESSGSYRTGSAPKQDRPSDATHTGLRTGRKPKRR